LRLSPLFSRPSGETGSFITTSDPRHAFRSTRRSLDGESRENISLSLFLSLSLFSNCEPMSRETRDAIRICTAHKHIKLKRPDQPDLISFIYLMQSLRYLYDAISFTFCQKYSMYKGRERRYVLIKRICFHEMRIRGFVSRHVKCSLTRSLRFYTLGGKTIRQNLRCGKVSTKITRCELKIQILLRHHDVSLYKLYLKYY